MMDMIFAFGIVWTVYGLIGLLGFQVATPRKFKGRSWTMKYICTQGLSWILLGVPWIILAYFANGKEVEFYVKIIALLVCSLPALAYSIFTNRKYKALSDDA